MGSSPASTLIIFKYIATFEDSLCNCAPTREEIKRFRTGARGPFQMNSLLRS